MFFAHFRLVRDDRVNISMDSFVRRYQPERYCNWLKGEDYGRHPDASPSDRPMPAPMPTLQDLECNPK
jgi:jumonji domain-containing protein 2